MNKNIIYIIISIILIYFISQNNNNINLEFFTPDEAIQNLSSMYNSNVLSAGNINATGNLSVNGNTSLSGGQLTITGGSQSVISSSNRFIIQGTENLYLLPKTKTIIGKEGGGTGNLFIEGNCSIGNEGTYPLYVDSVSTQNPNTTTSIPNISTNSGFISTPQYISYIRNASEGYSIPTNGGAVFNQYIFSYGIQQSTSIPCSAYFSGAIVSPNLLVVSDKRIKQNIKKSSNYEKLMDINICEYDVIETNKKIKYGLIAQELEEILPESVNTITDFIPNILETVSVSYTDNDELYCYFDDKTLKGLNKNDKIKFMHLDKKYETQILNIENDGFIIKNIIQEKIKNLFIIGKTVNDFKTVDFNSLISITIGVVQKQNKEIEQLKQSNKSLNENVNSLISGLIDITQKQNDEIEQLKQSNKLFAEKINTLTETIKNKN